MLLQGCLDVCLGVGLASLFCQLHHVTCTQDMLTSFATGHAPALSTSPHHFSCMPYVLIADRIGVCNSFASQKGRV